MAVLFTGGTISMEVDPVAGGALPSLDGAAILARTPDLDEIAEVVAIDWGLVPASHLGFGQLLELARILAEVLKRPDIDGAVVVQGTDTIEESSFAFDLLVPSDKPVVVTGAMRNAGEADYDGPRNLADAVRCAAAPALAGMGTLVVLNGLIVAADEAVKTHTTALDTFQPRDGEPVGRVVGRQVEVGGRRTPWTVLPGIPDRAAEPVHMVTAVAGMDGTLVRLLRPTRPAGLVVAATGAGNTHADLLTASRELIDEGTPVVLTTRCASGRVHPTYAFPGGGATWQRAGALLSGLSGPKARVALALGLGAALDQPALADLLRA
ncbi:MAG: asparaginase [Chloroflexota bacterium]|nr:asparaginase [Chloroflexota bacterium]